MGVSSTSARVGGVAAPVVVLLSVVFESLPLMIFGAVSLIAGFLILLLPETLGKPLPETLEDCEQPETRERSYTGSSEATLAAAQTASIELDSLVQSDEKSAE